jgi:phosphoesterase RecJ-like protein
MDFSAVKDLFSTWKKIFIASHVNPDGDSIGSMLALYHFFSNKGHSVRIMAPNKLPGFLRWMPGQENIMIYDDQKPLCDELMLSSGVIFSLDFNTPPRMGQASEIFTLSPAVKILIDHHIQPDIKAYDHVFSMVDVSSTSELTYDFMMVIDPGAVDKRIAECIYTGIMTDTGSFSYACNYEKTFRIVADLLRLGIDAARINRMVYSSFTEKRLRLLGYALSEKLRVFSEYKTAIIWLTQEELKKYDFSPGDTESMVNYGLAIEGIRFAVLFIEKEDKIRVSLRSTGGFSVNKVARNHYQGGGHINAAGGDSYKPMQKTLDDFEQLLPLYKDQLLAND